MLQIDALHAGYDSSTVLHGVTLAIQAGEIVAVLGRNGSGRSTLARAIMGLVPASGSVRWQGEPLASALRLDAAWGDPDGRIALVRVHAVATVTGLDAAEALGQQVVELLRQGGAIRPADLIAP